VTSGAVGSYLGVILRGGDQHVLGSLCVFDPEPRAWTDAQVDVLTMLAESVSDELARESSTLDGAAAFRLQLAAEAADLGSYDYDLRTVAVLGDVMGHGSVSAARAGQLHSVIATLALEGHGSGALLGRLASGIEQIMDLELATLLVCSYDPETRRMTSATDRPG